MSNWKKTLLGQIGKEIRISYRPDKDTSLPYIGYEHIDQQSLRLLAVGKSEDTQSKKRFAAGDIIFGTLRPYFRKVVIPSFDGVCSSDLAVIRATEGNDQNFLFYLIASQPLIDFANVSSNGTKMPRAKWSVLGTTEWLIPDLQTQKHISSILNPYDQLIDINIKRIDILEDTAKEIYKEWFVRMRFPGYKNVKFDKGIPDNWKVTYFRDFIKLNRGFDLPDEKIVEGNYPVVASTSIKAYHHKYKVEAPCVATGRSGSLGTVQYINKKSWPLNTSLYVKDFKGNSPRYVFYFLKSLNLESYNAGAGVPSLNQNHLHSIRFPLAPKDIQNKFDDIVIPMFDQIENLQQQNTQLRQIRDRLLPRLISGKLKIKSETEAVTCP